MIKLSSTQIRDLQNSINLVLGGVKITGKLDLPTREVLKKLPETQQNKVLASVGLPTMRPNSRALSPQKAVPSSNAARRAAVRKAQELINRYGRRKISVDGQLGAKTFAAYMTVTNSSALVQINSAIRNSGSRPPVVYPWNQLNEIARSVSYRTGVPVSYLKTTLELENYPRRNGLITTDWGKHKGLGQFNAKTWKSVTDAPWPTSVMDPAVSIDAIARLYKSNQRVFINGFGTGTPFTDEVAYLYHNQGASAAATFIRSNKMVWPGQSDKAIKVMANARESISTSVKGGGFT